MERFLNENEKIRKAEEIYLRRNSNNSKQINNIIERNYKTKTYIGSKILLEFIILLITACTVFAVKNKDFIFSQDFLEKISCYNINITEKIKEFLKEDNNIKNEVTNTIEENEQEIVSKSKEKTIVEKEKNALIKPINGIVTSRFGSRESNYKNVTSNHTGIDIASETGTQIISATNGIVKQVSTQGDYGNHVKISNNEMETLYAHCNEIYVEEGQEILQGEIIATVGNTGNSTGPHLHFEIRIADEPVDPSDYIKF